MTGGFCIVISSAGALLAWTLSLSSSLPSRQPLVTIFFRRPSVSYSPCHYFFFVVLAALLGTGADGFFDGLETVFAAVALFCFEPAADFAEDSVLAAGFSVCGFVEAVDFVAGGLPV